MKTYATGDIERKVSQCCYADIRDGICRKCGKQAVTLLEVWIDQENQMYIPEVEYKKIVEAGKK
jgi:hypothetical protein